MINRAIKVAVMAHEEQTDKAGLPYILHPLTVMTYVDGIDAKIVAILHDVVEDTEVTLVDLRDVFKFDEHIVEAVRAITHLPNEPNVEYWNRVCDNPLAKQVKYADIRHNSSNKRMMVLDEKTFLRLSTKYVKAQEYLDAH